MIALKCDLRQDPTLDPQSSSQISYEEGLATANAARASIYLGESAGTVKSDPLRVLGQA